MAAGVAPVVQAAGLVVWRSSPAGPQFLTVHRVRWDDWALPKGHVEPGELLPETAVREFHEETGYWASASTPVAVVDYPVGDTVKRVHWWVGRLADLPPVGVHDAGEIDGVDWRALGELTYADERAMAASAMALPPSHPLVVVRHAKAVAGEDWPGDDESRPLAPRGRRQAERLAQLLAAFGVDRLVSSPATRCLQTLRPFADRNGLAIEPDPSLGVGSTVRPPAIMDGLRLRHADGGTWAVCGHDPVLPALVEAFGQDPVVMKPATAVVLHLGSAQPCAAERYASPL